MPASYVSPACFCDLLEVKAVSLIAYVLELLQARRRHVVGFVLDIAFSTIVIPVCAEMTRIQKRFHNLFLYNGFCRLKRGYC